MKFDLDALCEVSAAAGPEPSPVTAIEKMEGGFFKAFLMKRGNGTEVIAKLPCRNAGPPKLTTASDVAVLRYCMCHSHIEDCHLNLCNNSKTKYGPSSSRRLLMEFQYFESCRNRVHRNGKGWRSSTIPTMGQDVAAQKTRTH